MIEKTRDQVAELNTRVPQVDVADFVDHIDYMVKLIGIDHVGISSDFDGGGGIDGWNDASETFNVTLELVKRGYSEQEIESSGPATCCGCSTRCSALPPRSSVGMPADPDARACPAPG